MNVGHFTFSPSLWPTLAAALVIALTVHLALWQVRRGDEKAARQALLDARIREAPVVLAGAVRDAEPLLYRRVRASGEWIAAGQIFIDNRVHEGRAGFEVVTPLRIDPSNAVLVDRGWIARGPEYPAAPKVPVPKGAVEVSGMASLPPQHVLELSADTVAGNVWQNLSIDKYRERYGTALLPFVILDDRAVPGLAAVRERPDAGEAKHREYALTWTSLAVTTLVLWIALNLKRRAP